jgi:RNA 2',3'-cyclic 3'-phosphodiesterase
MPDEILRTFIAIELDEPLHIALRSIQGVLKRQTPPGSVKWVGTEGIHLTLKFLGDTPASRIHEIETALRSACSGFEPFEFGVEGRGCFPNFRQPRVIWVAVRDRNSTLARLQTAVERTVAPLGWPTEERTFSPHLTLGRISKGADGRTAAAVGQSVERTVVEQIGLQQVSAVSLMQSDLRSTGAVYSRLLHIPLAPGTEANSGG